MLFIDQERFITVGDAVRSASRSCKLWREDSILGVQAYLLLMHQAESDTSCYVQDSGSGSGRTPVFAARWLIPKLKALETDSFLHTAGVQWRRRVQWASRRRYGAVARMTLADFIGQDCTGADGTAAERGAYLNLGLGPYAGQFCQRVFSPAGECLSTEREYPGWLLDTLAV